MSGEDPQGVRLQKALAAAGVASRRVCEQYIVEGRIRVNGEVVTELGTRIDPDADRIDVDGVAVQLDQTKRYVMLNKPTGVVSSMKDEQGRPDLRRYTKEWAERLYNVGRLDAETSGLLVLTNDGELAHVLAHPSFGVTKVYIAKVTGRVTPQTIAALTRGVELEDGSIAADRARLLDASGGSSLVELTLHSGRNRIVRRMMAEVGHPVTELVRREFGPLHLGTLPAGRARELTTVERGALLTLARRDEPAPRAADPGEIVTDTSNRARARAARVSGTVRIVGAGLLGSSIGHALRALDVDVVLDDASPTQLRLAVDYGAGRRAEPDDVPALIVVAVPPDVTAVVVERELAAHPDAVVTDVASVKLEPLNELRRRGVDLTHYIGSHPMAGRERGGALSARADIFIGRPWVVCRDEETPAADLALVEALALDVGATPIEMTPEEHDEAVALVSHVPQLVASLLAARFVDAPDGSLRLVGQGARDTTRIAASAPELWVQILDANAAPVAAVLRGLAEDLHEVVGALEDPSVPGARRAVADTIRRGNDGVERLPGKHGQNRRFERVVVMVDDRPGQLGRLFGELGELDVNVEDFRMEHSPGALFGLAEISVIPASVPRAVAGLTERGWKIASIPTA